MLDGHDIGLGCSPWLRPNDLIWSYWVNNYLLGQNPPAFDILYWNADTTRLPAAFHGDLLDFFKHNPLSHPGGLEVCGTPIDLQKVTVDSFSVAGINDHITPWDAVYRSTLLLGGERRFVLSNSGHVQSILNPPSNPKANFVESTKLSSDPRAWYYDAKQVDGSWWTQWLELDSGALGRAERNPDGAWQPELSTDGGGARHLRACALNLKTLQPAFNPCREPARSRWTSTITLGA